MPVFSRRDLPMQSTCLRICLTAPLILSLALPATASAQRRHPVDPSVLATTVARHAAKQDADRAAIRQALARPEVQQMADRLGVDLARMNATVATLAGPDLERSAAAARQ